MVLFPVLLFAMLCATYALRKVIRKLNLAREMEDVQDILDLLSYISEAIGEAGKIAIVHLQIVGAHVSGILTIGWPDA